MKTLIFVFLIAIMVISMPIFAEEVKDLERVSIYAKPEDQSILVIHYSTSSDLQCHFVTKSGILVGQITEAIHESEKNVYRILTISDPILFLDTKKIPVTYIPGQGFYSEIVIDNLLEGPHDFTWMVYLTYQKEDGPWREEAYSLVDWSQYALLPDKQGTRDQGKYHFEFNLHKTKRGFIISPVQY